MGNPLLKNNGYRDFAENYPVGTSQVNPIPMDTRWEKAPKEKEKLNLYDWVKGTNPQYTPGHILKSILAGALAGPEMTRRALKGEYNPDSEKDAEAMLDFVSAAGGQAFGGKVASGQLASLAGPMRFGDDARRKLFEALNLGAKQRSPREITQKTGWWETPDKRWQSEISDRNMKLKVLDVTGSLGPKFSNKNSGFIYDPATGNLIPSFSKDARLADVLDHPELFKNYPDFKDIRVGTNIAEGRGNWDGWNHTINIKPEFMPRRDMEQILLHEITHGTQSFEGWKNGSSPVYWLPKTFDKMKDEAFDLFVQAKKHPEMQDVGGDFVEEVVRVMRKQIANPNSLRPGEMDTLMRFAAEKPNAADLLLRGTKDTQILQNMQDDAFRKYMNTTGEAEARAVGHRRNLTDEQRALYPFLDEVNLQAPRQQQVPGYNVPWSPK